MPRKLVGGNVECVIDNCMIDIDKYNLIYRKIIIVLITLYSCYGIINSGEWLILLALPIIVFLFYAYFVDFVERLLEWFYWKFGIKNWYMYSLLAILFTILVFGAVILLGSCLGSTDNDDYEYWDYKTRFL